MPDKEQSGASPTPHCKHANQSGHPATEDIRMCHECDARSVDGGTTWMPFEEYQREHCGPVAASPLPDSGLRDCLIELRDMVFREAANLRNVPEMLAATNLIIKTYRGASPLPTPDVELVEANLADYAKRYFGLFDQYRNAWLREMGGVIRPKHWEIDGFVLRARDIYEKSQLVDRIKQVMVKKLKEKCSAEELFDAVFKMLAEDGHDKIPTN